MKFTIDRTDLAAITTWAAQAVATRPQVPVLTGMRVRATDGAVEASAFDYETSASASVPADVDEPGEVVVHGRLLAGFAAGMRGQSVTVVDDDSELELRCYGSEFTLAVMAQEQYPELPAMPPAAGVCDGAELARALARVIPAAGPPDSPHVYTTGIRFEAGPDDLTLVATDKYRLAIAELPWIPVGAAAAGAVALVPAKVLAGLARSMPQGKVTIGLDGTLVGFSDGTRQLTARCIAEEFPKWRRIASADLAPGVRVCSAEMVAAVRRVTLATEDNWARLCFCPDGIELHAGSHDRAYGTEIVSAATEGDPEAVELNWRFLLDGITAAGGTVRIGTGRQLEITSEQDDSFRYFLQPIYGGGHA